MNTAEFFKDCILQWHTSSKIAFVAGSKEITYRTLISQSINLVNEFKHQGLNTGDRIAVKLPNSIEFVYCYFACMLGGFTIVPINTSLPMNSIGYILEVIQPKLFIENLEQLKIENNSIFEHEIKLNFADIFSIFFTSGTTSLPKGVCHTLESMILNVLAFNDLVGLDANTVMMHVLPMGYMAGFLNTILSPILAGGTVIVAPQFNAQQAINFWQAAIKNNVNTIWFTPTMAALLARLNRDVNIAKWTEDNLTNVFVGTAPLSKTVKDNFEKTFKTKCLESYGLTETLIVGSNRLKQSQKDYSVGLLLNKIEVEVRNKNDEILPQQETGEIYIKSPFCLKGYVNKTHEIMYSPLTNGWFATGDYGYIDSDNYLFITGRIKDLIIHGGTNISPRAVEEIILSHPHIKDVSVIGKPHPFWGEEVVSFLIMEDNQEFDNDVIREYCQKYLQPDAIPTIFKIISEFPRSSTGKIQKHLLQEML
jgi:acyl-CoA synthetase (AMP-forming)/AMP-acid ligase II